MPGARPCSVAFRAAICGRGARPIGPRPSAIATADALAEAVAARWQAADSGHRFVVCTGGEPLLQLDSEAIAALHARGFEVAVETNGTQDPPAGLDWICVSPKAKAEMRLKAGSELKLVFPQPGMDPAQFAAMDFDHFYLQPMDGPRQAENTRAAMEYCLAHPQWRLSVQTHKVLGIR
jgi:7-carboxy-7-deazaguanine synthase